MPGEGRDCTSMPLLLVRPIPCPSRPSWGLLGVMAGQSWKAGLCESRAQVPGITGGLSANVNIPVWVHALLAAEYLPQTFQNALTLYFAKLLFPLVQQGPQDGKEYNRRKNETYCTYIRLIHGVISPRDALGTQVWRYGRATLGL